jgi:hypothetical protein
MRAASMLAWLPLGGCLLWLDYDDYVDASGGPGAGGSAGGPCEEATPCYGGPSETEGVGICVGGTRSCADGTCTGEVTPATETCADGLDEDCDGTRCEGLAWAARWGDGADQVLGALASDDFSVAIAGWYTGALAVGATELDRARASEDFFVALLDRDGTPVWLAGGADPMVRQRAHGAHVHPAGDVVVVGEREPSSRATHAFAQIFHRGDGSLGPGLDLVGSDEARALAVAAGDHTWIAGAFLGTLTIDGVGLVSAAPATRDVFVVKLDHGLDFVGGNAIRSFGAAGDDEPSALAVGAAGVFVCGGYEGSMTFSEPIAALPDAGANADAFVLGLDAVSGDVGWARGLVDGADAGINTAAACAALPGGVVVAGSMLGTTDFAGDGSMPIGPASGYDAFVAAYDAAGAPSWVRRIGGVGDQHATGVAVAPDGAVYVAGTFELAADWEPDAAGDELATTSPQDVFVARVSGGTLEWLRRYATSAVAGARQVHADARDGLLLGGTWDGALDLGGEGAQLSTLGSDPFVALFLQGGS